MDSELDKTEEIENVENEDGKTKSKPGNAKDEPKEIGKNYIKKNKESKLDTKRKEAELKAAKLERNVLKTLISVNVAFGLCWIWNAVWSAGSIVQAEFIDNAVYYDFSVMMMFCNVCVNPGLYAA